MTAYFTRQLKMKVTHKLQEDLDAAAKWENDWLMQFHPDKCSVMHITTKKNTIHHKYVLHQHTLQTESSTKYLGVTIQSDLKWNKHIDNISSTASKHLSRSRRFRILARKIEFGVFRLFRMRKKIFS